MRGRQRGFIVTLGIILLLTVVFIGLFVGISSVRDAWFKKHAFDTSVDIYVLDDTGKVLGKAFDIDEHETPRVPFVDYGVPNSSGDPANYRVLVGVRDDRFTSRERVYYPDTGNLTCTATAEFPPCIFEPSTESALNVDGSSVTINSQGVDELPGTGGVSYQLATQAGGGPGTVYNYAVGSTDGGLPGRLYRQTIDDCEIAIPDNAQDKLYITYWQSQRVVESGGGPATTPPCYKFLVFEPGEASSSVKCGGGYGSNQCCMETNPLPVKGGDSEFCSTTLPGICTAGTVGLNCIFDSDCDLGGTPGICTPQAPGDGPWCQPALPLGYCYGGIHGTDPDRGDLVLCNNANDCTPAYGICTAGSVGDPCLDDGDCNTAQGKGQGDGVCGPPYPDIPICSRENNYCVCPEGWSDAGGNQGYCCPPGVPPGESAGQCQQASKDYVDLQGGVFLKAEPVLNAKGTGNVLDDLAPPFKVNLPINPNDWDSVTPDGEGQ